MPIDFRCPSGHKLSVPDELAGRKARCPLCRRKMVVPTDNSHPNRIAAEVAEPTEIVVGDDDEGWSHDDDLRQPSRPDRSKTQTVYLLAAGLAMAALFAAAPAVRHWNLAAAPDWARLVLLLAAAQLLYIAWMVSIPDGSTAWVNMIVFALIATIYGAGLANVMYTPADAPLMLELDESARRSAAGWCAAVLVLTAMMTFACGRVSAGWRRSNV